jgi:hypothetical protein
MQVYKNKCKAFLSTIFISVSIEIFDKFLPFGHKRYGPGLGFEKSLDPDSMNLDRKPVQSEGRIRIRNGRKR